MLSVESALAAKYPDFFNQTPELVKAPLVELLRRLFRERTINEFLKGNQGIEGLEFIDKVLEYFNIGYSVSNRERENIPVSGRVVIFANHPLGALDALCLIKLISEVRSDVKIVANDMLMHLQPMARLLLPIDALSGSSTRQQLQNIQQALEAEQAVIFFPAGEVSRARPNGVRDTHWNSGFLKYAIRTGSPLLPCHIRARNSATFYSLSALNKPAAGLLLVHEMFQQRARTLPMRIGELVPAHVLSQERLPRQMLVKRLKRHLYRVGKGRPGLFPVEKAIAHPECRKALKRELANIPRLGTTRDGKHILVLPYTPDSAVMKEIGRLREISFRKVGEGTGRRRDLDHYDQHYSHLVLWDETELELVGAYRIRETAGSGEHLYTCTLFEFDAGFQPVLDKGLELGRSFVQPRYWGSRALDYLWQGIGAYLRHNPHIRYLFGPVSISNAYPRDAISLLVSFYSTYFSSSHLTATAQNPFSLSLHEQQEIRGHFAGTDYDADMKTLKNLLKHYGVSIPTLLKQYADVFHAQGVHYLAWNVDLDFGACVDGLLVADLAHIKDSKKRRYIDETE